MSLLESYIALVIEEILSEAFLTKQNQEITFTVHEKSPDRTDQQNNAWVVHKIEAHVNGKEVGWIKISYVPTARFQAMYPSLIHYLQKNQGRVLGFKLDTPEGEFNAKLSAMGYGDWRPSGVENMNPAQLKRFQKKIDKDLDAKFGSEFREFQEFHLDKPLVDYILVKEEARRQGIGAALYEYAARWLAQKGMKLYASGVQSQEAVASWEWLKANKGANIGTETGANGKVRTFLSYL